MTRLSTMPSIREQARRALLLIGAPAPARLVVDVHGALFGGDLSRSALAALLRDEEREWSADAPPAYSICPALQADLTADRGRLTLSTWPVAGRIAAPAADGLAAVVRIAEFVAMRESAGQTAAALLRGLADGVPGGPEAYAVQNPSALADAARAALAAAPATQVPEEIIQRWATLDPRQRVWGGPTLPQQRRGPA